MKHIMDLLMQAFRDNNYDYIISTIREENIDPNATESNGIPLLIITIMHGRLDIISLLLEKGADPNVVFSQREDFSTPLLSSYHSLAITKELIRYGANVNYAVPQGFTALHCVCLKGSYGVIRELVESGCDVNKKPSTCSGNTPLHIVVGGGSDPKIIRLLLEAGADPLIKNNLDLTSLDLATEDIRQLLMEFPSQEIKEPDVE